jgi:uncharacterized protein YecT (DUF1311 family)
MEHFTKDELNAAYKALLSTLNKCEKVEEKSTLGKSQQTLLKNRIKAIKIALALIIKALNE